MDKVIVNFGGGYCAPQTYTERRASVRNSLSSETSERRSEA